MNTFFESFSTREIAIIVWLLITVITCMFFKNIRNSMLYVIKSLFAWKISVSLVALFAHTGFYIFILYNLNFWNISLLKDSIILVLSFGFISLMNISKVNNTKYFKNIFIDAIKWTILIEFITNFFTFTLTKEFFLIPILFFSGILQVKASMTSEHKKVEELIKNILTYFSIFVLFYSFYKTIQEYREIFNIESLKSFLLPVILTITFIPFIYLYTLIVKYEELWIKLNFLMRNESQRKKIKRQIIFVANLGINKLTNISQNIAKPLNVYNDYSINMLKQISKGKYIESHP